MQMVSCPRLSETVPAKLTKGASVSRYVRIEINVSGNKRGDGRGEMRFASGINCLSCYFWIR